MGIFNRGSSEAFAAEEENRGNNLVRFINNVVSEPSNGLNSVLPLYQAAVQDAYGNAAKHTEQPGGAS